MKHIPALLLVACTCNVHAQTADELPTGDKYAVKAYLSGLFSPYNNDGYNWRPLAESRDYIHPSAAVMIRTQRGNFHEFEISNVDFRHTDVSERFKDPAGGYLYRSVYKLNSTRIAFRYEYIITLTKRNNARLIP
ncbi:MAG: hypothetical protein KDC07_08620, partial [Chitinophagaceae bacterium]|nr:hypothetical protein [Chitinophagaceae bacterium]